MDYFQLPIDSFIDNILSEMILCLIILQLYLKKAPTPGQALSLLDHCSCFTAGSDLGCPWIGSDVKTILTQMWLIIGTEGAFINSEGALRLPTTYDNHPIPIPSTYSCEDDLSIEDLI